MDDSRLRDCHRDFDRENRAAALDFALTPAGVRPPDLFALSLWIGWGVTLVAAELWIRYTRAYGRSLALA